MSKKKKKKPASAKTNYGIPMGDVDQTSYVPVPDLLIPEEEKGEFGETEQKLWQEAISGIRVSPKQGVSDTTHFVPPTEEEIAESTTNLDDPLEGIEVLPPPLPTEAPKANDPGATQRRQWVDPNASYEPPPEETLKKPPGKPRPKRASRRLRLPSPAQAVDKTMARDWNVTGTATDANPADVARTQFVPTPTDAEIEGTDVVHIDNLHVRANQVHVSTRDEPTNPDRTRNEPAPSNPNERTDPDKTGTEFDRSKLDGAVGRTQLLPHEDQAWLERQKPDHVGEEGFKQVSLDGEGRPKTVANFNLFEEAMSAPAHLEEETHSGPPPREETAELKPDQSVISTQQLPTPKEEPQGDMSFWELVEGHSKPAPAGQQFPFNAPTQQVGASPLNQATTVEPAFGATTVEPAFSPNVGAYLPETTVLPTVGADGQATHLSTADHLRLDPEQPKMVHRLPAKKKINKPNPKPESEPTIDWLMKFFIGDPGPRFGLVVLTAVLVHFGLMGLGLSFGWSLISMLTFGTFTYLGLTHYAQGIFLTPEEEEPKVDVNDPFGMNKR